MTAAYESIGERSSFGVKRRGDRLGSVLWRLLGDHNLENALAALAAALHVGVPADVALAALGEFSGVKRRLEKRGEFAGIALFEDFAHHPTAIATTLAGLRSRGTAKRIVAVMEPRSNTMRMGVHRDTLAASFAGADRLFVLGGDDSRWDVAAAFAPLGGKASRRGERRRAARSSARGAACRRPCRADVERRLPGSAAESAARAGAACATRRRVTQELPLFPLQTVLFPGGPLNLRIFETRYLDMVASVLRGDNRFGVVAIRAGSEVGEAETFT